MAMTFGISTKRRQNLKEQQPPAGGRLQVKAEQRDLRATVRQCAISVGSVASRSAPSDSSPAW